MTMHAVKGLEFPVVFITGCEDGLIPYRSKKGDTGKMAEEGRLFYVALTRAQERVFLTHTEQRLLFGRRTPRRISPFLQSIEENLKQYKRPSLARPAPKKGETQLSLFGS
jgi:DNA helicase-2/ATP-dependent DNA helicase PcrA